MPCARLLILIFLFTGCVSHQPAWQERHRAAETAPWAATENELVVYVFPAPVRISYDNPRALLTTFLAAGLDPTEKSSTKHAVGHVFLRLRWGGRELLTGQTTEGNAEEKLAVNTNGYGLGYLGAFFHGKMDDPAVLEEELQERLDNGEMVYLRLLLNEATAQRLWNYIGEYTARGYDRWWGQANRPRYGEGGACASFTASVLEVGGLLRPEFREQWTVSFRIPQEFYGGPLFNRHVPPAAILADNLIASRWARQTEPHVLCTLWEPTRIHDWILDQWETADHDYLPERTRRACGLRLDCRALLVPNDPFWLDPVRHPNPGGRQPGPYSARQQPCPTN